MFSCLTSGNNWVCARSAKVSRKGKQGMSQTGLRHPRYIKSGKALGGERTTLSPQSVVIFTLCTLRMQENPNTAIPLHQVFREKDGRKQGPETSRSITRHKGTNSRNLVLHSHKEAQVTGLEKYTKTFLEKVLSSYLIFAVFWRSLDHLEIKQRLLREKGLQAPNYLGFSSALA